MNKKFDLINVPLEKINLIEASAGTGKTYSIAGLYLRLLVEKELTVDNILVTTYTDAATAELRTRIRNKIQEAVIALEDPDKYRGQLPVDQDELIVNLFKNNNLSKIQIFLENSLRNFDEAAIYTIHSFCGRVLKDYAFESGSFFNSELITDQSILIENITDDFWRKNFYFASESLIAYIYAKKIKRKSFIDLLSQTLSKPFINIIPTEKEIENIDLPDSNKLYALFDKMKKEWSTEKSKIEILLTETPGIKQNIIKKERVPVYIAQVDEFLTGINPFLADDNLKRFDQEYLYEKAIKKEYKENPPTHSFFDLCSQFRQQVDLITKQFDNYYVKLKCDYFKFVKEQLFDVKNKKNIMSFDDLLVVLHKAINSSMGSQLINIIRNKYSAAMIDEFQDTDPLQYEIFDKIFNTKNNILFFIGDPKQAIYSFRGADIFAYLKASRNVENKYYLTTNWRSEGRLLNGVNSLFTGDKSFIFDEITYSNAIAAKKQDEYLEISEDSNVPFKLWFLEKSTTKKNGSMTKLTARTKINQSVISEILKILNFSEKGKAVIKKENSDKGRKIFPKDIAILVRTHSEAKELKSMLIENGVPGVIQSRESVFRSNEMYEINILLQAIAEPNDSGKVLAALSTNIMGMNAHDILKLEENDNLWSEILLKFELYRLLWETKGFIHMFRTFLVKEQVRYKVMLLSDGTRRLTNLLHLSEIFHKIVLKQSFGISGLLGWINDKIINSDSEDEYQLRLETDEEAVKIVTIHTSKGLQYPIVFAPFCWNDSIIPTERRKVEGVSFHDKNDKFYLDIRDHVDNHDNQEKAEREILAENIRLLYVALTRAKYRCYLAWGLISRTETSALAYLFNQDIFGSKIPQVNALKDAMANIEWENLYAKVNNLVKNLSSSIEMKIIPIVESYKYISKNKIDVKNLKPKNISKIINNNWKIASYSFLTSGVQYLAEHYDNYDDSQNSSEDTLVEQTIYDFPKGADAGTCLHEVFEKINFNDDQDHKIIIETTLQKYNYKPEWNNVISDMVANVLKCPLNFTENIFLKNLTSDLCCKEMEFYFPIDKINIKNLIKCYEKNNDQEKHNGIVEALKKLKFKDVSGFLKGFIDLVFEWNSKYYIIDWKSNYLGSNIESYSLVNIKEAMKSHLYYLQSHIYSVALYKYLKSRIKNFNYEKHFGGVCYIFLRGICNDNQFGLFVEIPDEKLITDLSVYFSSVGGK